MIILVPEINFLNFPLFFILSFIFRIKTYKILSFLQKYKARIELLDLSEYFDWEKCELLKSDAVAIWENMLPNFPNSEWKVSVRNFVLDLTSKAKQDFQREIERKLFLQKILQNNKKGGKVCIVNSLKFNFLSKIDNDNNTFHYPQIRLLSMANILLDRLSFTIINLYLLAKVICQFIYGIVNNRRIKGEIKYIYDGVSPRELSIDKNKITFSWLVDNELVHKKEILFLLPKADFQMRACAFDYTKDKELLASDHFGMLRFASNKKIFSGLCELVKVLFKRILFVRLNIKDLMLTEYSIRILEWLPLAESLKPKVYISTFSNLSIESPAIIYFNKAGIKTVMWTYGTNSYLFLAQNRDCKFRDLIFCNIISSILVVWNRHFKEFIGEHPQDGLKIEVMGPLMSGDERVFDYNKQFFFEKLKLPAGSRAKCVAIFDSPPVASGYRGNCAWCPNCNSEEYNYLFLRDVYKLLLDFGDIVLVYKPKRSLTSGKFSYSTGTRQLFNEMNKNPRVAVLDYNINPWFPIAVADICISMPFESPTVAAWHYEKPALFHDPLGIALCHRYQTLSELISHNYEELKSKVKYWLFGNSRIADLPGIGDFQGTQPRENSSNRFRKYLNSLTN